MLPRNSATMFQNPDLQTHGFSAATSLNSMVTLLRLWGTYISLSSSQSAILDSLATELKILGGSLTLLLHGCESDIESMVKESKEKMNQSSLCFASQLGRLLVSMGPEGSFMMIEKCSLEQVEVHVASISSILPGWDNHPVGSHLLVTRFVKGVNHLKPPRKRALPQWSLSLALNKLLGPPFEPMATCDMKYLTWKTAFLMAVTSAGRDHR
ncbi:UNVERIFIED_CONTAM: hypothetical protein FKN15_023102 [Acipenser sinensis]